MHSPLALFTFWRELFALDCRAQVLIIGNLRTTTTTLSTTTGSEIPCTAQARLANFVVVVSSTTPNTVESRRPVIHKLRQIYLPVFKRFFKGFVFFYPRKSRYPFFFLLTSDVDWKFDWWIVFTSKTLSCGGRASELVSDKFSSVP